MPRRRTDHMGEEKITLRDRILRHRSTHPRDKISFGEEPVPKPTLGSKSADGGSDEQESLLPPECIMPDYSKKGVSASSKVRTCRCGRDEGMGRCQSCRKWVCRRCRIIESCHTRRFSHGWTGQAYSGGNSFTNPSTWGGNGIN